MIIEQLCDFYGCFFFFLPFCTWNVNLYLYIHIILPKEKDIYMYIDDEQREVWLILFHHLFLFFLIFLVTNYDQHDYDYNSLCFFIVISHNIRWCCLDFGFSYSLLSYSFIIHLRVVLWFKLYVCPSSNASSAFVCLCENVWSYGGEVGIKSWFFGWVLALFVEAQATQPLNRYIAFWTSGNVDLHSWKLFYYFSFWLFLGNNWTHGILFGNYYWKYL